MALHYHSGLEESDRGLYIECAVLTALTPKAHPASKYGCFTPKVLGTSSTAKSDQVMSFLHCQFMKTLLGTLTNHILPDGSLEKLAAKESEERPLTQETGGCWLHKKNQKKARYPISVKRGTQRTWDNGGVIPYSGTVLQVLTEQ